MKKITNNNKHWEEIFPEVEFNEVITEYSLEEDAAIKASNSIDTLNFSNLNVYDYGMLASSSLPSLTASDLYTIDFANIGNITTINLSALNTSSSNAIWTGASAAGIYSNPNSVHISGSGTVQIPEDGDLIMGNVSLKDRLDKIESRLGILHPSPEIEKEFSELKSLGEQYRALEQEIKERLKTFETLKKE